MHSKERTATLALAFIMAFRMLGLFMILPVFALYVKRIPGATPALIGVAIGIYGLTQAALQIPFGLISDKIGRKPVITAGLILFMLGSAIAALSSSIDGLIIGRALQGSGAIGSTVLALAADLTKAEERTKAMAMIGMVIACSFTLAMVLGPLINAWFALSGIFWATLIGASISLLLLYTMIPTPTQLSPHPNVEPERGYFKAVITNPILLRLDFGIFALHATLTALFIAVPVLLAQTDALQNKQQALFYFTILVLSFAIAVPFIILAEKKRKIKSCFLAAILLLCICTISLAFAKTSLLWSSIILLLFFAAFTLLEATLPSWISKIAPPSHKGTAMGIYSSSQFLGIFVGGSIGGWIFGHFFVTGVFIFCACLALIWLMSAITLPHPP